MYSSTAGKVMLR